MKQDFYVKFTLVRVPLLLDVIFFSMLFQSNERSHQTVVGFLRKIGSEHAILIHDDAQLKHLRKLALRHKLRYNE